MSVTGPFATEEEARKAALILGGPVRPDWSILSPEQRLAMLTAACEQAGVELGAYDMQFLAWLSDRGDDPQCAVLACLILRTRAAGGEPPW